MNEELLGRMDEKLDNLIEFRRDHELRIKALENLSAQAQGGWKIIVVLAALSGAVGGIMGWVLSHFK